MKEEKKITDLKMEILEVIPENYQELRAIVERRTFSIEDLEQLLRTARKIELLEDERQRMKKKAEQLALSLFQFTS